MLPSWNYMTRLGLYDFTVDQNKMNTSFVTQFQAYGDGFMFINASGAFTQDVNTVLHEFAHYNAIFATEKNKEGKSYREIAKIIGKSDKTIKKWIEEYEEYCAKHEANEEVENEFSEVDSAEMRSAE